MNCNQSQPLTTPMTMQPLHCKSLTLEVPPAPASTILPQPHQGQSLRKSRYVPRSFVQHNYHDRSNELPDCTPNVTRGGISTLFPQKLHATIDRMAAEGYGHICSWQPHGRSFVVHSPKEFEGIMPRYFGKMKMASFQRQLNLYGFMRLTHGPDKGGYYHELFLQHRYYLSRKIQRCRVKGNGARSATNPDAEPNFYAMPPVSPTPQVAPVPQPMLEPEPVPAAPVVVKSSPPPVRSMGPRQVSLSERDLVRSLEPSDPVSKQDSNGQVDDDSSFWASIECLMENMDVSENKPQPPESEVSLSLDDMTELEDIIEPPKSQPQKTHPAAPEIARSITLRPKEVLSSEATILDNEVTEFLKVMFEKDEPPSSASATKKTTQFKGISTAGSANAVAYARRDAFRRRRSACNAAA